MVGHRVQQYMMDDSFEHFQNTLEIYQCQNDGYITKENLNVTGAIFWNMPECLF